MPGTCPSYHNENAMKHNGLRCPSCGSRQLSVVKTFARSGTKHRVRQCATGCQFETVERPIEADRLPVTRAMVARAVSVLEAELMTLLNLAR